MKEALGGVSIFQIVVVFILIFTAIMCLTINHSKAFGVKDEIINIIENSTAENYNGVSYNNLNSDTISEIVAYLNEVGYRIAGSCPAEEGWVGYDRNGSEVRDNAAFCVKANDVANAYYLDLEDKCKGGKCNTTNGDFPNMIYYDLALFYQLDIPILGSAMNLRLYGSTKVLFGD